MKRTLYLATIIISSIILIQCASNGFLMAKAKVSLFGDSYPAKNLNSPIDVFVTRKPEVEYIEFAKIVCRDTNDDWSIKQIKIKALEIGADGIIIVGKAGGSGVGLPIGNSTYVVTDQYGMTAIAIKYK